MAVKLRMKRFGAKRSPFYRIVAADARAPRDGRDIETIGTYNPVAQGQQVELNINEELALKWLANGAQPTGSVKNLLSKAGIMQKHHNNKQGK